MILALWTPVSSVRYARGMQHTNTLKGSGIVTWEKGKTSVKYEIQVWQARRVGSMPGASVRGWILPVCCPLFENAVLESQDGRKLMKLYFADKSGGFVITEELDLK